MFRRDVHAGQAPQLEEIRLTVPSVPSRSCCCPARPAVKAVMPPTAARRHSVDLWLCGHHYRASQVALLKAGARIEDLSVMTTDHPQPAHAGFPA